MLDSSLLHLKSLYLFQLAISENQKSVCLNKIKKSYYFKFTEKENSSPIATACVHYYLCVYNEFCSFQNVILQKVVINV